MDIINIYENYNNYFNDDLKSVFKKCSKIASINNFRIYLVGGIVRDLLLGIENFDVDITVEGNAIDFCRILERENIAKIISIHKPFATAKVEVEGIRIDFASTRSESYPKKGHLPVVEKIGCSLELDVIRRDFTINSLALSLNSTDFGSLFDYVGGYKDLSERKLRVLHDKSFIDDPTRILRGLKFSHRLGFDLDKKTYALQKEYLKQVNCDMSYKRLKSELVQCFSLCSDDLFQKFVKEKMYKLLTSNSLQINDFEVKNYIEKYKAKHAWVIYFALMAGFDQSIVDRIELSKGEKEILEGFFALKKAKISADLFEQYRYFEKLKPESLLAGLIFGLYPSEILLYLDELKKIKVHVTGNDLLSLGLKPSKKYKEIFDEVLREKLKNPNMKKSDELKLAASIVTIH